MWFKFPEGTTQLSCQQQNFKSEFKDEKGADYFQAPAHFAPSILDLKGFVMVERPDGAPDDLPKSDPLHNGAIEELSAINEALRGEIKTLREDLTSLNADYRALIKERDDLAKRAGVSDKENKALRERLDEFEDRARGIFAAPDETSKAIKEDTDEEE